MLGSSIQIGGGSTFASLADITIVRKTADETVNNSTTLQDDDELLFAIAANEIWYVKFVLRCISNTTPDIKYNITAPSGATLLGCYHSQYNVGPLAGVDTGAGANRLAVVEGLIINSTTAGNITLQWAQNTQDASDTKVLANSCLIATRIA